MAWETISFDCYGTLVDWEAGITSAFSDAAAEDGIALEAAELLAAYHHVEPQVQAGPYRSYRDVLAETALQVAERLAWPLPPERAGFLAESLPDWPLFPDTRAALERLKSGYRLAILSNIDDDLLQATIERIGVAFDWTVTAEQVGSYKPGRAHFREALRRLGGKSELLLHVAQSYFHDVRPATELGISTIWLNRKGESPGPGAQPLHEVAHLGELGDWLGLGDG